MESYNLEQGKFNISPVLDLEKVACMLYIPIDAFARLSAECNIYSLYN